MRWILWNGAEKPAAETCRESAKRWTAEQPHVAGDRPAFCQLSDGSIPRADCRPMQQRLPATCKEEGNWMFIAQHASAFSTL